MIDTKIFLSKESFAEKIEEMVIAEKISYFEAIIAFADDCNRDPDELLPMMSRVLLDKVRKAASDAGMVDLKENDLGSFLV